MRDGLAGTRVSAPRGERAAVVVSMGDSWTLGQWWQWCHHPGKLEEEVAGMSESYGWELRVERMGIEKGAGEMRDRARGEDSKECGGRTSTAPKFSWLSGPDRRFRDIYTIPTWIQEYRCSDAMQFKRSGLGSRWRDGRSRI